MGGPCCDVRWLLPGSTVFGILLDWLDTGAAVTRLGETYCLWARVVKLMIGYIWHIYIYTYRYTNRIDMERDNYRYEL